METVTAGVSFSFLPRSLVIHNAALNNWCGDYRGCEHWQELDKDMEPRGATWLAAGVPLFAGDLTGPGGKRRSTGARQRLLFFALMMTLMRNTRWGSTGQMERNVGGAERMGEKSVGGSWSALSSPLSLFCSSIWTQLVLSSYSYTTWLHYL